MGDSTGITECKGIGDTSCAADNNGHGTHCAGTIGGKTFGVAKEVTLHAMKVFPDNGRGSFSFFLAAIDFVIVKGERPAVISASLGGRGTLRSVTRTIQRATAAGVTIVVAAGNEGETSVPRACDYTPAGVQEAITVGSITKFSDQRSSFSNIGDCVDLFAPGSAIVSAGHRSDGAADTFSGTSMACPHVAGAAALVLEQDSSMTPAEVTNFLLEQASTGTLRDAGVGSPNKVLFVGFEITTTTHPTTPLPNTQCCIQFGPIRVFSIEIPATKFFCTQKKHFWQFYC